MVDVLPSNIKDLEWQKFTKTEDGNISVRIKSNGGFSNPKITKIVVAKDGSYIKYYNGDNLVKQLNFSSNSTEDIIEEGEI